MKFILKVLLAFVLGHFLEAKAFAGRISALIGPPSVGQGGSNPVSIPPVNPLDWQFAYITDKDSEFVLSVIPGLFYGSLWRKDSIRLGLGGGILISPNGIGLGLSQSVAWESAPFWSRWRFEAEYRQVVGYTQAGAEFPYAIRMGVNYEL